VERLIERCAGLDVHKSLVSLWEARSGLKMGPVAR
jgi:hypothetical protein